MRSTQSGKIKLLQPGKGCIAPDWTILEIMREFETRSTIQYSIHESRVKYA